MMRAICSCRKAANCRVCGVRGGGDASNSKGGEKGDAVKRVWERTKKRVPREEVVNERALGRARDNEERKGAVMRRGDADIIPWLARSDRLLEGREVTTIGGSEREQAKQAHARIQEWHCRSVLQLEGEVNLKYS